MLKHCSDGLLTIVISLILASAVLAQQPPDIVTSDANRNTAMGASALEANQESYDNTAVGQSALQENVSGSYNTGVGDGALQTGATGDFNTAIGYAAMLGHFNNSNNVAVGAFALSFNDLGNSNVGVGYQAMYYMSSGYSNVAVGSNVMHNNHKGVTNTAVGDAALYYNVSGSDNVAIGHKAVFFGPGSHNIGLGSMAGYYVMGSNNIDIGNEGVKNDAGVIRIGAPTTHTAAYIAGISTTQLTGAAVYVSSSGQLGVLASSERYKTAIAPLRTNAEKFEQLRPVTFHLKTEPKGVVQYGLIAEEVDRIYPELVIHDAAGRIQGVRYDELAPILLRQAQQDHQHIAELEQGQQRLQDQLQSLQASLERLQSNQVRVVMR